MNITKQKNINIAPITLFDSMYRLLILNELNNNTNKILKKKILEMKKDKNIKKDLFITNEFFKSFENNENIKNSIKENSNMSMRLLNDTIKYRNKKVNSRNLNSKTSKIYHELMKVKDLKILNKMLFNENNKLYLQYNNFYKLCEYDANKSTNNDVSPIKIEEFKINLNKYCTTKSLNENNQKSNDKDKLISEKIKNMSRLDLDLMTNMLIESIKKEIKNLNNKQLRLVEKYINYPSNELFLKEIIKEEVIPEMEEEINNDISELPDSDPIKIKYIEILNILKSESDNIENLNKLLNAILEYYNL